MALGLRYSHRTVPQDSSASERLDPLSLLPKPFHLHCSTKMFQDPHDIFNESPLSPLTASDGSDIDQHDQILLDDRTTDSGVPQTHEESSLGGLPTGVRGAAVVGQAYSARLDGSGPLDALDDAEGRIQTEPEAFVAEETTHDEVGHDLEQLIRGLRHRIRVLEDRETQRETEYNGLFRDYLELTTLHLEASGYQERLVQRNHYLDDCLAQIYSMLTPAIQLASMSLASDGDEITLTMQAPMGGALPEFPEVQFDFGSFFHNLLQEAVGDAQPDEILEYMESIQDD